MMKGESVQWNSSVKFFSESLQWMPFTEFLLRKTFHLKVSEDFSKRTKSARWQDHLNQRRLSSELSSCNFQFQGLRSTVVLRLFESRGSDVFLVCAWLIFLIALANWIWLPGDLMTILDWADGTLRTAILSSIYQTTQSDQRNPLIL